MNRHELQATVDRIFHEASERPPREQAAYLDRACTHLPNEVRAEVESLLQADRELSYRSASFLERGDSEPSAPEPHNDTQPHDELLGTTIGPYTVQRRLGGGGFGVVYLAARAGEFEQQVALKLIHSHYKMNQAISQRFELERQLLSDLSHSNIARLLDGGSTPDGRPYFVMEYVDGQPITQYCDTQQLTVLERLRLFQQVCLAVAHAHQYSIIHRDLKPANIMVDTDGVPKLVDFGIAKLLDQQYGDKERSLTQTGQLIMTPEYASPEQANGEPVGMASDVYSLGIVLYELLTGQRPYEVRSSSHYESVRIINEIIPPKPSHAARTTTVGTSDGRERSDSRTITKALRGDLDNITLKALRKEPDRRYQSAQEVADDIQRYFDGMPVAARRGSAAYHLGKFVRRNRASVAIATVAAILLMAAMASVFMNWRRSSQLATRLEKTLYESDVSRAYGSWKDDNFPSVDAILRRYVPQDGETDLRDSSWYFLAAEYQRNEPDYPCKLQWDMAPVVGYDGQDQFICFVFTQDDPTGTYYTVDINTGKTRQLIRSPHNVTAISRDGQTVTFHQSRKPAMPDGDPVDADGGKTEPITLQRLDGSSFFRSLPCDIVVEELVISDRGDRLGAFSRAGDVRVWDIETGQLLLSTKLRGKSSRSFYQGQLIFSRSGEFAAFAEKHDEDQRNYITVWDLDQGTSRQLSTANSVRQMLFSIDDHQLFIGGDILERVDLTNEDLQARHFAAAHVDSCRRMDISPSGRLLAFAGNDGSVRVLDATTEELISEKTFIYWIPVVYFHQDEDRLLGVHFEKVWSWGFGEDPGVITRDGFAPNWMDTFDVHANSGTVIFAHKDGNLVVWETRSNASSRLGDTQDFVIGTAISPNGKLIALGTSKGRVEVYDRATSARVMQVHHVPPGIDALEMCVALSFSPDSHRLISGGRSLMCCWEVATGQLCWTQDSGDHFVHLLEFDQSGRLYSGHFTFLRGDDLTRIWDVTAASPKLLYELTHPSHLTGLALSPDDRVLVTTQMNGPRYFDLTAGAPIEGERFNGHGNRIADVSFTPDGKMLLTASSRGVTVWNVASRQELFRFYDDSNVHAARVLKAADGSLAVVVVFKPRDSDSDARVQWHRIDPLDVDRYWRSRP